MVSVSEGHQRLTRSPLNTRDHTGFSCVLRASGLLPLGELEPMRGCRPLGCPFCECF